MRLRLWSYLLGVACLAGTATAQNAVVKPDFMVIVDTSASMLFDPMPQNSCGYRSQAPFNTWDKMGAAKCTLTRLIDSTGDANFGLERYTEACSGAGQCTISAGTCDGTAASGEVLVGVADDNANLILPWVDNQGSGCSTSCGTKELTSTFTCGPTTCSGPGTPIGGAILKAQQYYLNNQAPTFPSPIVADRATVARVDQCRPYRVILLTDGLETCGGNAPAAATALRTTTVGGQSYDVKTFVVGFGVNPGDASMEAIARAGGTDNTADPVNAAFYAQNETELSSAFSQIIQDSVLVEKCNGVDDNCNGVIDEGFQKYCNKAAGILTNTLCSDPGDPCGSNDNNCVNGTNDEVKNACGGCGPVPAEVCNGLDDNCDGFVDVIPGTPPVDVCAGCVPSTEICDGKDNDCDGRIDEGVTRACGSPIAPCTLGTQTCVELMTPAMMGTWGACSGIAPTPEVCDGIDNDCDGTIDGMSRACGMTLGQCQAGTEQCVRGTFQGCTAIGPSPEICDGLDNNCNNMIDEGDPGGGAACNDPSICGAGKIHCVAGRLTCVGTMMASPEVCNGADDDCDGQIDNGIPDQGPCGTPVAGECKAGTMRCLSGRFQCVGYEGPKPESCNCLDDDCNGTVDNPPAGGSLCPSGSSCVDCQCALPCGTGEFPCPAGKRCRMGFCVADPCSGITCPADSDGTLNTCQAGTCVPLCDTVTCDAPLVCRKTDGACVTDDCNSFPARCNADQLCKGGVCVTDPCLTVTCGAGTFCKDGQCTTSCATLTCGPTETCKNGACVASGCSASCATGELCDPVRGMCVHDRCAGSVVMCGAGKACDPLTGTCISDPCIGVTCPQGQTCKLGDCFAPGQLDPDAGVAPAKAPVDVLATGAGGCQCELGGDRGPPGVWAAAALAALLLLFRRRRSQRRRS